MQNSSKKTIGFFIVLVIIVLGVVFMKYSNTADKSDIQASTTSAPSETTNPAVVAPVAPDVSDSSIQQDTANLDSQLNGFEQDKTSASSTTSTISQ